MSNKLIRTLLLAAAIGFLVMWVLEFRRTTLFESYWLLLLGLMFLLMFQLNRLKQGLKAKKEMEAKASSTNKPTQKNTK